MLKMIENRFIQVAIVTDNLMDAKTRFTTLFGFPNVPEDAYSGAFEITKTEYCGSPAPDIDSNIAYFNFGNIQIEIIEPSKAPSAWRDWLNTHGESVHHLSFFVADMDQAIAECSESGLALIQHGYCADGVSRYAYLDTNKQVPFMIEYLWAPGIGSMSINEVCQAIAERTSL